MNHPGDRPTQFQEDCLDFAMLSALLISLTVAWLTWTLTSSLPILSLILLAGFLFTFTVTPHLVAYWLDIHVDVLLGMRDPPPIHQ